MTVRVVKSPVSLKKSPIRTSRSRIVTANVLRGIEKEICPFSNTIVAPPASSSVVLICKITVAWPGTRRRSP